MICSNISIDNNRLIFAGREVDELAEKYGTPLYLLDEDRIRTNCRTYRSAFDKYFKAGSKVLYASKAASFRHIYSIISSEDMGIDVVSPGEIYTAASSGFDMSQAFYHSSAKSDQDISYAMDKGVGCFVVDCAEEMRAISAEALRRGITQNIFIRITPGIDPHTYAEVETGLVDSKFGSAIETGQADEVVAEALTLKGIHLLGFHSHVGSMVFGEDVYEKAVEVMVAFMAHIRNTYGFTAEHLDIGGGFGVRYVENDPYIDISRKIADISAALKSACEKYSFPEPVFYMEPGRSIVADAGMTIYTVQAVKKLPGYKNYISVDGGMTDNPRFALYKASYTCLNASRLSDADVDTYCLAGRCCESGDVIQEKVCMSAATSRGDLIAVCTTGAYNYSMASNYNRVPRPPIVMLSGGKDYIAVRREKLSDLCLNDL